MEKRVKIGINGFGRIGGGALRAIIGENYDVEVEVINTTGELPIEAVALQFKYDSVYGRIGCRVEWTEAKKSGEIGRLIVQDKEIAVLGQRDPAKIGWKKYGVETVLECTGAFTGKEAERHLKAGAKKVVISAPAKEKTIPLFIMGVNEERYKGEKIISNGSCTTNCAAPIVKIIDEKIGFEEAILTTIHAYTSSQGIVDGGRKDPRRGRAAGVNIVPTTTGAANSVIRAYPEAEGRFIGTAIRVPVICGSFSNLTFKTVRKTSQEEVNAILEEASVDAKLVGKLKVSYEPLVSSDIIGNNASCVVDSLQTRVVSDDMLLVGAWYDNEYGYCCRLVEMAMFISREKR